MQSNINLQQVSANTMVSVDNCGDRQKRDHEHAQLNHHKIQAKDSIDF